MSGELERYTRIDDSIRRHNRKLGRTLGVQTGQRDEIAKRAAHRAVARGARVVPAEYAIPILVNQGVSLDRQRQ